MRGRISALVGRRVSGFVLTLLLIEFMDEFIFGTREAAWPLIRDDLHLDYAQVGILLGVPNLASNLIEPWLGILGDVWKRKALMVGGGLVYTLALFLTAASGQFYVLLFAFVLMYPAAGAFVGLGQATLMDTDAARHEHNMARWTFAGSVGVLCGALAVGAVAFVNTSWRWLFVGLGLLTIMLALQTAAHAFPRQTADDEEPVGFREGVRNAARALKRGEVLRWLTLLEFSDLMLDILLGFLALYMVDVARATPEQAALAVLIWQGVGLVGDFLLIPLLERVRGLSYLRVSAVIELVLFVPFLLAPQIWVKFVLLGLLGFFNAGWYSILKGRLYSAMPGQSGTVMSVGNVFGLVGGLIPLALGLVANYYGLQTTMWLLLLGPLALLVGLPRRGGGRADALPG